MPKPLYPPPDEIDWEDPPVIPGLGFGPELNTNNILWYFMNSPFYDDQFCNNSLLLQKLQDHPNRNFFYLNRVNFENELRRAHPDKGISYFVTQEPKKEGEPWVIQKQMRREEDGKVVMEVQGVYYTIKNKIVMAPSLLDVLQSRLHAISYLVQDLFEKGQSLDHWSPATGHTYMPSSYKSSKPIGTIAGSSSRAGSVVPGDLDASQLSATGSATQQPAETQTTEFSDAFFLESLRLTNNYGTEYMDENPLQGEPGAFVFASTKEQVEARNKAQAEKQATAATLAAPKVSEGESAMSSIAPTPKPVAAAAADAGSRKGSVVGMPPEIKKKRRKSKGLASPISPTGPTAL